MKGLHLEEKVNMSICIHSEIWKKKKNPLLFGDFPLTGLQKKMRLWNEQMKWNNKWKWKSITPVVLINNKLFLSNFKAYINHGYL